jgi:hypothetical protein
MRAFMLAEAPTLLCNRSRVDRRRCPAAHKTSLVAKWRVILSPEFTATGDNMGKPFGIRQHLSLKDERSNYHEASARVLRFINVGHRSQFP